ncbi:major royal jelly protein [Exophiala viscosa]|uniref:Major royal jelly protein n=1 Tax=Exophiala viscosa TaxID=2486360 RepID=A0AAN6IEL8_9EURO|nr:major royal jelly protein [Exophiala viscosa]KAI1624399.1 major royal jelly protein [Exophiala viscosa]
MYVSELLPYALLALFCSGAIAQDPRVQVALTLQNPVNGVSSTPDGRLFILYARVDGSTGPQVAEWHNGSDPTPYPNAEWNSYAAGKDPATHLIRTNSQRIGPDGTLWLVDTGSPSFGEAVILPEGPKLVQVNLTTNSVARVYNLGNVTLATSLIDDVRFNPAAGLAYITDAGTPGIIVLDLSSGDARRVLEDDPTTKGFMPVSAEGKLLHDLTGGFEYIYADQHEVSPDGQYYYYQPCSGGMSRIETQYLNEAFYNSSLASLLSQYPEPYALTPSTGGTAIDAAGNIYNSDTDRQAIIKISPDGSWTTLVQDPRLLWVDAMWIDTYGKLWMPAAQLNRGTPFNNGSSFIQAPLYVYTIDIGIGPSPIDHA